MVEVLPIKFLTEGDANIFGKLNVLLARLKRADLPVAEGIVVTSPSLKLKTTLEYFDLKSKEIFEQTLELVKSEIKKIPVPENLEYELKKHRKFLIGEKEVRHKEVWHNLLFIWLEEIKHRLYKSGFNQGITEDLESQVVIFINDLKARGLVFYDPLTSDSVIKVHLGEILPKDYKKLDELVTLANKKLLLQFQYEWILDQEIKISQVLPISISEKILNEKELIFVSQVTREQRVNSVVRVFIEGSKGLEHYQNINGVYISSEKIFDLNKSKETFEDLTLRVIEAASDYPNLPILVKLPDQSEGMGKVRGALRLIHQKSLFEPIIGCLIFARNKHQHENQQGHPNIHIVIPFIRNPNELMQVKRELAVRKLLRKNSLQIWMEAATPENIINLEHYLICGVDGVVLNLDELIAYLNGFDHLQEDLLFYKTQVSGLIKFLEDGCKLLHKSKMPFLVSGSISMHPQVLEFLVEKGMYGIVVEKYDAPSANILLHQIEKRLILSRS